MLKTYARGNCIAQEFLQRAAVNESFVRKIVTCSIPHSTYSRQLGRSLGIVELVGPDTAVAFMEKGWLQFVFLPDELDVSCGRGD